MICEWIDSLLIAFLIKRVFIRLHTVKCFRVLQWNIKNLIYQSLINSQLNVYTYTIDKGLVC